MENLDEIPPGLTILYLSLSKIDKNLLNGYLIYILYRVLALSKKNVWKNTKERLLSIAMLVIAKAGAKIENLF